MSETILLTGGLGYIGSHCAVELLNAGYRVILVDNLCNSHEDTLEKIRATCATRLIPDSDVSESDVVAYMNENCVFFNVDLANAGECRARLWAIFEEFPIAAVIHLAAHKSVPESVEDPIVYFKNNLFSLTHVLDAMDKFEVHRLIFSSSATVYGDCRVASPKPNGQIAETAEKQPTNPYGQTKWFGEQMCESMARAWAESNHGVRVIALRYGNPVNSRPDLPENPRGAAMNLFNVAMEVVQGTRDKLCIFGDDYPTPDGTGVRDFIHVVDLAEAHVAALRSSPEKGVYDVFNVGIGHGYSVLDIVGGLEQVNQTEIPREIVARRPGDVASLVFDVSRAKTQLNWQAQRTTLLDLCQK
uniref:UDP-glucose 4-epimerase n=1 Tax=viral metagenome TaxID=1070528 RepID=A0A6C0BP77_9ZZZZ